MMRHYSELGVGSFWINVLDHRPGDELTKQVASLAAYFAGSRVLPITDEPQSARRKAFASIASYPDDWFIFADQEEFQQYPTKPATLFEQCQDGGFDCISGCFIDRVSRDGYLRSPEPGLPLWEQYPIGAFLSRPMGLGIARKLVAAKGSAQVSPDRSRAIGGAEVPISRLLIPVHHFKWLPELVAPRAQAPVEAGRQSAQPLTAHDVLRFYFGSNGNRINLNDPAIMAARCDPQYPHWETLKRICLVEQFSEKMALDPIVDSVQEVLLPILNRMRPESF